MEQLFILQGITVERLLSEIDDILVQRVSEIIKHINKPKSCKYITRKEAASILKVSLPTLHEWSKHGMLKCYKINNRVLYKEEEIIDAIERKVK